MARWLEFEEEQPDLARRVRDRFDTRKHKTIATLRADGSPRISGIELEFQDGDIYVGMMPRSRKAADVLRDPRLAIHSPTEDPPEGEPGAWKGEAKLAGHALEVKSADAAESGGHRFRVAVEEVALVHLNEAANRLVVESWREGRGYRRLERE